MRRYASLRLPDGTFERLPRRAHPPFDGTVTRAPPHAAARVLPDQDRRVQSGRSIALRRSSSSVRRDAVESAVPRRLHACADARSSHCWRLPRRWFSSSSSVTTARALRASVPFPSLPEGFGPRAPHLGTGWLVLAFVLTSPTKYAVDIRIGNRLAAAPDDPDQLPRTFRIAALSHARQIARSGASGRAPNGRSVRQCSGLTPRRCLSRPTGRAQARSLRDLRRAGAAGGCSPSRR